MPAWVTSPVHRSIVAALVDARHAAGLTQRDVAKALGKPPSYVAKVEGIERNLSVTEFIEWCQAVGSGADDVFGIILKKETNHD